MKETQYCVQYKTTKFGFIERTTIWALNKERVKEKLKEMYGDNVQIISYTEMM